LRYVTQYSFFSQPDLPDTEYPEVVWDKMAVIKFDEGDEYVTAWVWRKQLDVLLKLLRRKPP